MELQDDILNIAVSNIPLFNITLDDLIKDLENEEKPDFSEYLNESDQVKINKTTNLKANMCEEANMGEEANTNGTNMDKTIILEATMGEEASANETNTTNAVTDATNVDINKQVPDVNTPDADEQVPNANEQVSDVNTNIGVVIDADKQVPNVNMTIDANKQVPNANGQMPFAVFGVNEEILEETSDIDEEITDADVNEVDASDVNNEIPEETSDTDGETTDADEVDASDSETKSDTNTYLPEPEYDNQNKSDNDDSIIQSNLLMPKNRKEIKLFYSQKTNELNDEEKKIN